MRYKHNKRRNIAFLYEVLIQELTKAVVCENIELQNTIKGIIKEHLGKGTNIGKELKLYRSVYETKDIDSISAEKILQESKREYDFLDKEKLFLEQGNLLFKIKKILGPNTLSTFVPNYKHLASLSQIFNRDVNIKSRVLLENEIINSMMKKPTLIETQKMVPIDNLVLKTFTKRFNDQYSILHEEQKTLLSKYITSFSDNGLELKVFLNEEINRLKTEIKKSSELNEIKSDAEMLEMTKQVLTMLEGYSKQEIDNKMIEQVIKCQGLVREVVDNAN